MDMNSIRKIKKNNKGSALIVCIIILLFVSILATVILYMAGSNYRMKKNDLYSRMAFYSAEMPLDRMQSNLIIPVSAALNDSYRVTNSLYAFRAGSGDRRREFYSQFALAFRDLMIKQYGGGTGIGGSGETIGDARLVRNIVFNLVKADNVYSDYNTALEYPRGEYFLPAEVNLEDIYINSPTVYDGGGDPIIGLVSGPTDPMGYVRSLSGLGDRGDGEKYFEGNADGTPRAYVCISSYLDGSSATEIYNKFIRLSVTGDPDDDPVFPTATLLDPDKCRLLIKNVSVVVVENGYMSVVNTDIAIQFPPLDWGGGGTTDKYEAFAPNQLIYYVNWQKN